MFDNDSILLEKVLDFSSMEIQDSSADGILSRLYSELLKKFMEGIPNYFVVDENLHDNSSNGIYGLLDSKKDDIKDCQSNSLLARYYSSDAVLDSRGRTIGCHAVFLN